MSTTIDNKVVSMQFDNKHFEKNVQTSMSTLDKLKQKLRLDGAAKGIQDVDAAAKKVNLSHLGDSVDAVKIKFSALQIMGVTALQNITNSAVNAGKRMVSALTIDPVKTGFQEYETQINAVQTILANTSNKGTTIDQVNEALEQLNKYADMTIYNFTEMTRNIGTFTAAGVDLDTSVSAIKGIANLAAVSGSTSQQASTAMYQLSQALAAGKVSLMDWNSVVNAGMGGEVFQNALRRTSEVLGTGAEAAIKEYGSFRESLTKGEWLTTEVLTETLNQFTLAAEEGTEQWETYKKSLKEKGYTEEQANEILKMANTATDAATKVKTFTQLWDVLKEAAQSGWSQTWKIIIGDFEEAKAIFTPLADFFTGLIGKMSDFRNNILELALGARKSPFGKLIEQVTNDSKKLVGTAEDTEKDYSEVVKRICRGDFKNADTGRYQLLAEAGYNWAYAQNKVNEELGYSFRYSQEIVDEQWKLLGVQKYTIDQLAAMSDEQLKNIGYTQEQIDALRELSKHAEEAGKSISEFIESASSAQGKTGRDLLMEGIANLGKAIGKVFSSIGSAWKEIFLPQSVEELAEKLYNAINAFNKFSQKLIMSDESAEKLKRTFKGLFAAIDIVFTLIAGPIKIAFKVLKKLFEMLDVDILSFTAGIGDAIVRLRDWIDENNIFIKGLEIIVPRIKNAIKAFKDWIAGLKEAENLPRAIAEGITNGFGKALSFIASIPGKIINILNNGWDSVGDSVVVGLAKGIWNGIKLVGAVMIELGKIIIEKICDVLGIHSPSRVFFEIGGDIIMGLVEGIRAAIYLARDIITTIGSQLIRWMKDVDFGTIISTILSVGGIRALNKFADAFAGLSGVVEGIGDMFEGVGEAAIGLAKYLKASAWDKRANAILKFAVAIGVLVGAIYLLTLIEPGKLWAAIGALAALAGIIVALAYVIGKLGDSEFEISKKGIKSTGTTILSVLGIALALLVVAKAVKSIADMGAEDIVKGIGVVTLLGAFIVGLMAATKLAGDHIGKMGGSLLKMSVALLLLIVVMKLMAKLDAEEVARGILVMTVFGAFVAALIAVTKIGKNTGQYAKELGSMILKISIAMLLLVGVIKLISMLDGGEIAKGVVVMGILTTFIAAFIVATAKAGKNGNKAAVMMLGLSMALLVMVGVIALLGLLDVGTILKGTVAIAALSACIAAIVLCAKNAQNAKGTVIAISILMAVLTASLYFLTLLDTGKMLASTVALSAVVLALSAFLTAFARMTGKSKSIGKSLAMMGVIAGVVLVLGGVIILLSQLDPVNAIASAGAIGTLLLALTGALAILDKSNTKVDGKLLASLTTMIGVVLALGVVLLLLSSIDPASAIGTATALSTLLVSLTGAITILSLTKGVSTGAYVALAAMLVVVAGLSLILKYLSHDNPAASLATALGLSALVLAMSKACVLLAAVGVVSSAALAGIAGLLLLVAAFAALIAAFAGLCQIDGFKEFMASGIDMLIMFADGVGRIIGAFVGGIVGGFVTSALEGLGDSLSKFMEGAQGFIEGARDVDSEVIDGAKNLALAILAITGASFINAITTLFSFGQNPLITFGQNAVLLAQGLAAFSNEITRSNVNAKTVDTAANAGKALSEMMANVPSTSGIFSWFTGRENIANFKRDIVLFAEGLVGFSEKVNGVNAQRVENAAEAGKLLVEMCDNIPMSSGLVSLFTGWDNVEDFGKDIVYLGEGIKGFSDVTKGIRVATVEAAAEAGVAIAEMADMIPSQSGLVSLFTGWDNIEDFGKDIVILGQGIAGFAKETRGINTSGIVDAAEAGVSIAEMCDKIPTSSSFFTFFTGNSAFDTLAFADTIGPLGEGIKTFAKETNGIKADGVQPAIDVANAIVEISKNIPDESGLAGWFGVDDTGLETFAGQLETLGDGLNKMSSKTEGVSKEQAEKLVNLATAAAEITKAIPGEIGDVQPFADALPVLGDGVSNFASKLSNIDNIDSTAAKNVGDSIAAVLKVITPVGGISGLIASAKVEVADIEAFAGILGKLGQGVMDFYSYTKDIEGDSMSGIGTYLEGLSKIVEVFSSTNTAESISKLNEVTHELEQTDYKGTSTTKTFHMEALASFVGSLGGLGTSLKTFYDSFGSSMTPEEITAAGDSIAALGQGAVELARIMQELEGITGGNGTTEVQLPVLKPWGNTSGQATVMTQISELSAFASDLKVLGPALKTFSDNTVDINPEQIGKAIEAIEKLSGLTIPDLTQLSMVTGIPLPEGDAIKNFKQKMVDLGTALKSFYDVVVEIGDLNRLTRSANAAETVVQAIAAIQLVEFAENGNIENLKTYATELAKTLSGFSTSLGTIDATTTSQAVNVASNLITVLKKLLDGDINFSNSGEIKDLSYNLVKFGIYANEYYAYMDGVTDSALTKASQVADSLKYSGDTIDADKIDAISEGIKNLGDTLDGLTITEDSANGLIAAINKIGDVSIDGVKSVIDETSKTVEGLAGAIVDAMSTGLGSTDNITILMDSGRKIMSDTVAGAQSEFKENSKAALTSLATSMVLQIGNSIPSFVTVGENIAKGVARGVQNYAHAAISACTAMAANMLTTVKQRLYIQSPSRAFADLAKYVPLGFAKGVRDFSGVATAAVADMADDSIKGVSRSISAITDIINMDVDTQPTIRPVLDLSDVESGAAGIAGLFGMTPSVGVMSRLGSISTSMSNNQNGSTLDVISAIKDLGKAMGNRSGDTYQINGVSVDDDTSVIDAVKTIVRAARIERRV